MILHFVHDHMDRAADHPRPYRLAWDESANASCGPSALRRLSPLVVVKEIYQQLSPLWISVDFVAEFLRAKGSAESRR